MRKMETCPGCKWSDEDEKYNDSDWWWEIVGCRRGKDIDSYDDECEFFEADV